MPSIDDHHPVWINTPTFGHGDSIKLEAPAPSMLPDTLILRNFSSQAFNFQQKGTLCEYQSYHVYIYTYISIIRMNIWIIYLISDVFRSLLGARTWKQLLPLFSCEPIATWCDNVQYFSVLQYNVASGIFKSIRNLRATLASCKQRVSFTVCGKCHLMEDFLVTAGGCTWRTLSEPGVKLCANILLMPCTCWKFTKKKRIGYSFGLHSIMTCFTHCFTNWA